jgi:hypothetical protein
MCCFFLTLLFFGPRFAILIGWFFPAFRANWELAFDSFFIGFVGWLFVPWTTLMYVLVAPGGVAGFDWVWLILALLADIASWGIGSERRRLPGYDYNY